MINLNGGFIIKGAVIYDLKYLNKILFISLLNNIVHKLRHNPILKTHISFVYLKNPAKDFK